MGPGTDAASTSPLTIPRKGPPSQFGPEQKISEENWFACLISIMPPASVIEESKLIRSLNESVISGKFCGMVSKRVELPTPVGTP